VTGTHDVDHVLAAIPDDPVEVGEAEVEPRRGAPVAEQPRLDVRRSQRLGEQRIIEQVDLPYGQVVRRAPIGVDVRECVHDRRLPHQIRPNRRL
jgi:hypothetical protein